MKTLLATAFLLAASSLVTAQAEWGDPGPRHARFDLDHAEHHLDLDRADHRLDCATAGELGASEFEPLSIRSCGERGLKKVHLTEVKDREFRAC